VHIGSLRRSSALGVWTSAPGFANVARIGPRQRIGAVGDTLAGMFAGGCHCGALRVRFEPTCAPEDVELRRCECSFCRKHGATTATDPQGLLELTILDVDEAVRYRFGTRTADYLLCGRCGVYVAAVMAAEAGAVATLNVDVLDARDAFTRTPRSVSYEDESAHERRLRRAEHWTVTTIVVPSR
jgi:hypothetical protein